MDRLKKFFVNGILMTMVALAVRYVSVGFNVYISNKIGAVAMGIFTLIGSVYGFALTLATSGISLATTKLVSEALGYGVDQNYPTDATISSVMKKSLLFALSLSSAAGILLFLSASYIGTEILADSRTVSSLKILAISLPPIALSSSMSGYFSAIRRVYKNAIVQILSQGIRIYTCVMLLSSAVAKDMESACVAIVSATVISETICFAIEAVLFYGERRRAKKIAPVSRPDQALPSKLLKITIPVALSAYMRSALVTVEHLLIPWGLERSGATRELSLAAYGTIHSIVFPLVLFPSAISSSFAGLLVPEISESDAAKDSARIGRIVSRVLKTVLIYSIGTAGILMCLSSELGHVLFPKSDSASFILMIAPLVPVMYLDTSVDSILKGLGYQFYTMVVNIVDASLSVILVWLLLPRFGIMGYVITVYFTEIVNATLSITKLITVTKTPVRIFDWIVKPIVSIIISTALLRFILGALHIFAESRVEIFLHVVIAAAIYFLFLLLTRALSLKKIYRSVRGFINA
jgi:stage V sporulation protein B